MFAALYYALIFILSLFLAGRLFSGQYFLEGTESSIKKSYLICSIAFITMCFLTVGVGVSTSETIDKILLYLIDFSRMFILVYGAELCAVITNRKRVEKRTVYLVSSELLYIGVATLIVRTIIDSAEIKHGLFGTQFVMGKNFATVFYIVFHIVILFFYGAYTYLYYYSCTKKREFYIFRRCMYIVIVLAICLFIEVFCILNFGEYVPVMVLGILFCFSMYKRLLMYRRSIEYNESDYEHILSPTYEVPALVCDDKGVVIFENTRAFVMRKMYKDSYKGKYLSDLFDMPLYDLERLRNPKITEPFDIFCNYHKEKGETKLIVRHNIDQYKEIISTEVEIYAVDEAERRRNEELEKSGKFILSDLSLEDLNSLRIDALIYLIEVQKELFEQKERTLFILNLKGIEKNSKIMGISALNNLCIRMMDELNVECDWEALDGLMIELDRQYETLKLL